MASAIDITRLAENASLRKIAGYIGIAPEGVPITIGAGVAGIILIAFGPGWLGVVILLLACAVGAFFRDPERVAAAPANAVISGADGKVTDIADEPMPGEAADALCRRVSVFMSPLNVHVNRAPTCAEVVAIAHTAGEFRAAFRDDANEHNERNLIIFADSAGRRHALIQIAGYLARRIVCRVRPHDRVERGQRLGMIMFGSRVDHFMPLEYRVTVKIGDHVRAGESVIGEL
ncbi:MAG: phosphatidylserine decarboxylase [Candidatus Binataceae bacterium]